MGAREANRKAFPYNNVKRLYKYIRFVVALIAIVVVAFWYSNISLSQYFPIKTVRIYGLQKMDSQALQKEIHPLVADGFFAVDINKIKETISEFPWVEHVMVRKNWPDQVIVNIIEKKPLAIWNHEKILSSEGDIFSPDHIEQFSSLPLMLGPQGQQLTMMEKFSKIQEKLNPLQLKIAVLELSPYFVWSIKLHNDIMIMLGQKDILTRVDQFVKVYPKIVGNYSKKVDYIDLRYTNGIAVRMKPNAILSPIKSG